MVVTPGFGPGYRGSSPCPGGLQTINTIMEVESTDHPDLVAKVPIPERRVARSIEALPSLPSEHTRVVHITNPEAAESVVANGLSYKGHGMLSSVARWWNNPQQCEFFTDDLRFSFPGAVVVVMDVPFDVIRLHDDPTKAPGMLSAEYVVGVVEAKKQEIG